MVTSAQRRFLGQGAKLGKYEVIRQIAVGRMAELYLARTVGMEGFEKLVCVKRILPQFSDNPNFVNLFVNEAQLAATLHHPNIAQVYDIGQEQAEFFFAMEYIHGEDLGRLVTAARDSGVAVSLDCALTVASGLCAGLHHAHEKASPEGRPFGVVHRDVSPTNVLVSYDGAVKLVDFGIARASGEPMASITGLKGKIAYMSPEQCRGKVALDRRSDVFSIGTILYELTTGRLPFVDATEYGVLQQIVNRDAEPPSRLVGGYPPALEAIVMRALSRDVERRFSTALELQNQLEDFAHDNRLRVSPLVLARLMSTLFPARLEEWDHARAQGAFFVEQHVVRTLIESGKTPEGGSRFVPQPPAEPFDEAAMREDGPTVPSARWAAAHGEAPTVPAGGGAGASMTELPTVPAVRGSAPRAPGQPSTQPPPMGHPRLPTPPPPDGRGTAPGQVSTALSQPRLSPPGGPPGGRYAQMPVPNMPGAVPIVAPLMAHPVASAGTLVSNSLQAGTSAAAAAMPSMPLGPLGTMPGAGGAPGQMGPAGGAGMMPGAPGMPGAMGTMPGGAGMMPGAAPAGSIGGPPGGYVPAASGDFGRDVPSRGNAPGYGFPPLRPPTGPGDASRSSGPQAAVPNSASAGARSRTSAQRTMVMRAAGRARWPIVAGLGVAVAGTIAVVVAIGLGGDAAPSPGGPGVTAPSPADPGNAEAAKAAGSGAVAADPAKPGDPVATESAAKGDGEAAKAAAQVVAEPAGAAGTGGTAAAAGADPEGTGASGTGAAHAGATSAAGAASAATGANGAGAGASGAAGTAVAAPGANGTGANGAGANGAGAARTVAGEPGANSDGANGAGGASTRAGAAGPGGTGPRAGSVAAGPGARTAEAGATGMLAAPSDDGSKKPRKPARPRGRADAKRSEPKRGSKADPKEPSWNDDSPFLPVQTPKR